MMLSFIINRVCQTTITLIVLSLFAFFLMKLLPGDPVVALYGDLPRTPEEYLRVKREFGLDKPMIVQYINWLAAVLQGDLGRSIVQRRDVVDMIRASLPITLYLSWSAVFLAALLGIPLGVIAAIRRGKLIDSVITFFANVSIGVPAFWLGTMLIYSIAFKLQALPISGFTSPFDDFGLHLRKMVLPVTTLSFSFIAFFARQMRSAMLEVVHQDYIRTAWSKGLRESTVVTRHAVKNALIPIITTMGVMLGHLVGGTVLVETVFNIPGMGRLIVQSMLRNEFFVMQGCILVIGTMVALVNLLVDILYSWIDPRIRLEK